MHVPAWYSFAAAILVTTVVGCGELPLADFGEAFAASICEREARCCTAAERLSPTEADCRSDLSAQAEALEALIVASTKAGRLRYDARRARECFVAEGARDCTDPTSPAACDEMLVSLVPNGGACTHDDECEEVCRPDATGERYCQAVGTTGDPCLTDEHCAPQHYCEFFTTCSPTVPLGEACDLTSVCDDGLYCDLTSAAPTCIAQPPFCVGAQS